MGGGEGERKWFAFLKEVWKVKWVFADNKATVTLPFVIILPLHESDKSRRSNGRERVLLICTQTWDITVTQTAS